MSKKLVFSKTFYALYPKAQDREGRKQARDLYKKVTKKEMKFKTLAEAEAWLKEKGIDYLEACESMSL